MQRAQPWPCTRNLGVLRLPRPRLLPVLHEAPPPSKKPSPLWQVRGLIRLLPLSTKNGAAALLRMCP